MNSVVKSGIIFASGLVVGGVSTWFGVKTYYREKANNEIAETQEMYYDRLNELSEAMANEYAKNSVEDPEVSPEDTDGLEGEKSSLDIAGDTEKKKAPRVDYSKYFKKAEEKLKELDIVKRGKETMVDEHVDASELESPEDDEELTDEEDEIEQDDYEMYLVNEEHKKAVAEGRAPYVIEDSEFGKVPGYDTMDLYYYTGDNVLADEDKEEVDAPALFVGDLLECDWVHDDTSESVCVRSDVTMTDVEVHKIDGKFYND